MALDIIIKEPSLKWTENNGLYNCFKAWQKRAEILTTGMVMKKEPHEFICHCIKACSGEMGHAHIEGAGLMGDDAHSMKCILDTLKGHCRPRSNERVAATAYK